MMEAIREFYWNMPEWGRWAFVIWITSWSFKEYLKNLYSKKDFTSASFCIMLFVLFMYGILNYFGSDFNLISGGN